MTYYHFFPVRNGESTLRQTLESLFNQTVQPSKVIVVDDGSTDNTSRILDDFLKKYPDMMTVIKTDSKTSNFQRIPHLWNMCLDKKYDFHMIGADDCVYQNDYAERLLENFAHDENLVICSGDMIGCKSKAPHGAGRFVRQSFFYKHYTNYPEIVGYESEILFTAIFNGHKVRVFNDVTINHLRKLGKQHNFSEFGQGMRAMGYHPIYVLLRFVFDFGWNKTVGKLGSISILYYYLMFDLQKNSYISYFPEIKRKQVREWQSKYLKLLTRKLAYKMIGKSYRDDV